MSLQGDLNDLFDNYSFRQWLEDMWLIISTNAWEWHKWGRYTNFMKAIVVVTEVVSRSVIAIFFAVLPLLTVLGGGIGYLYTRYVSKKKVGRWLRRLIFKPEKNTDQKDS